MGRGALPAAVAATLAISACAVAWGATPRAYTEQRRAAKIAATLSYTEGADFGFRGQRLVVRRAGRTALDVRLTPEHSRWPAPPGHALALRNLDAGEPEVLVSVYTGGANCCYALYVFRFEGGRYRASFFNSGKGGLTVVELDRKGPPEIRSTDGRFHYLFSSGAESYAPVRIYRFRRGALVAVTREFPALVRDSEAEAWQVARKLWRNDGNPHTALAAWAAAKYLLGEGAEVWPRLTGLIEDGTVEATLEHSTRRFLPALRRALRDFGYLALPQA